MSTDNAYGAHGIERCEEPEPVAKTGRRGFLRICCVLCLLDRKEGLLLIVDVVVVAALLELLLGGRTHIVRMSRMEALLMDCFSGQ